MCKILHNTVTTDHNVKFCNIAISEWNENESEINKTYKKDSETKWFFLDPSQEVFYKLKLG